MRDVCVAMGALLCCFCHYTIKEVLALAAGFIRHGEDFNLLSLFKMFSLPITAFRLHVIPNYPHSMQLFIWFQV